MKKIVDRPRPNNPIPCPTICDLIKIVILR